MSKDARAFKALIAGKYNGVQMTAETANVGSENTIPEGLAEYPRSQVPVLNTPEGTIWESNAIARHVARLGSASIYGKNAFEAAQIDQWIDFSANNIDPARDAWIFPAVGLIPNDHLAQLATCKAMEAFRKILRVLNQHLLYRTFLVGERVTLADIVLTMALFGAYTMLLDSDFRKDFPNVSRWFQTCVNQPNFASVLGSVTLCENAPTPEQFTADAKRKGEQKGKSEKGKGKQKVKAERKPNAAKEKRTDKPASEHGAGEQEVDKREPLPKEMHPLDLLPPTRMSLVEWKRIYSDSDTVAVALPWFWQNFDPEGYSLWKVNYQYNDELNAIFKITGLVCGWLQRVERLRKYAFGSILIHGKDSEGYFLSGVWLFRGSEIPRDMLECDDATLYNWTKLDIREPATRTLIDEYFAWEGDFSGKGKPVEGKIFK